MVLYEVNAEISKDLSQAYLDWLKPHIELILKEPGFLSAEVFQEREDVNHLASLFTVHYYLKSPIDLENYLSGPASKFREEAIKKFGKNLSVRRRELFFIFEAQN